jgi:hypothetical protein
MTKFYEEAGAPKMSDDIAHWEPCPHFIFQIHRIHPKTNQALQPCEYHCGENNLLLDLKQSLFEMWTQMVPVQPWTGTRV